MSAATGLVNPSSGFFTQGLNVLAATVSETKGFLQISEFAIATIALLGKVFAKLPVGALEFSKHLQTGVQVLVIVSLINDLKWWFCDKRQSWQHTAHKATLIALEILQSAVFFDAIQVIDLGKIAGKIGGVPVIGLVVTVFTSATTVFSLWHHARKIVVLNKTITTLKIQIKTEPENSSALSTLAVTYIERNKVRISILSDISTLALCILGIIGVSTGVAILAFNSWLMLVLGLVVTGIGVYDAMYGKAHPAPAT